MLKALLLAQHLMTSFVDSCKRLVTDLLPPVCSLPIHPPDYHQDRPSNTPKVPSTIRVKSQLSSINSKVLHLWPLAPTQSQLTHSLCLLLCSSVPAVWAAHPQSLSIQCHFHTCTLYTCRDGLPFLSIGQTHAIIKTYLRNLIDKRNGHSIGQIIYKIRT